MDCQNSECVYYNDRAAMNCNMDFVASLDNCAAYKSLITKTALVAEVPCSVGLDAKLAGMKENYTELLMAVESKYPGETRHDTALRYIKEAERSEEGQACSEESN